MCCLPHRDVLPYYLLLAAVVPVGPPVVSRAIARMRVRALGATRPFYCTPGLAATVVGAPVVRLELVGFLEMPIVALIGEVLPGHLAGTAILSADDARLLLLEDFYDDLRLIFLRRKKAVGEVETSLDGALSVVTPADFGLGVNPLVVSVWLALREIVEVIRGATLHLSVLVQVGNVIADFDVLPLHFPLLPFLLFPALQDHSPSCDLLQSL
mmetsp:Transcript_4820/g.17509  ORF Transcript_4820/g.17509 Transcript_4820/m.17509 type:complete len:212 (+) Transcript_4820:190-825(+)